MSHETSRLREEQQKTLETPRRSYGFFASILFSLLDLIYGKKRTLSKFKVLEVIARVPYQAWEQVAYIAMTHTYAMPNFARRIFEFVRESRRQQDNEQWHLLILEELTQKKQIRENFFLFLVLPQVMAFLYYHLSWLLYVIKPAWSYALNVDFEDHAEHEYMEFVKENPELESEPFESDFKADFGDFKTLADLFRKIGLDERIHKEEGLARVSQARFSDGKKDEGERGRNWVAAQVLLLALLIWSPEILRLDFFPIFRFLGVYFVAFGFLLGAPTVIYLGRNGTPFPKPVEKGFLVRSGPYHLVRHPMYLSAIILCLGWSFWSANFVRFLITIGLFVLFDLKSRYEEELLEKTYPEFSAYRHCVTKRLIPWLYIFCFLFLSTEASAMTASSEIRGTQEGSGITGSADFEETAGGLKVSVEIQNAPPGFHGFHIHEKGDCGDSGKAAGGHFNPDGVPHGDLLRDGFVQAHAGDFGNIEIEPDGRGVLNKVFPELNLGKGPYSVAGRSLILHEKEDDYGQPTGNAGGRIACGVIHPSE